MQLQDIKVGDVVRHKDYTTDAEVLSFGSINPKNGQDMAYADSVWCDFTKKCGGVMYADAKNLTLIRGGGESDC